MAVPGSAAAGRNHFGWLYDTDVDPEGTVELETWVLEEDGAGDASTDETRVWWAPTIGVTDQLELALPIELRWFDLNDDTGPHTALSRFGVEARWRLVSSDPVEAPPVVPLLRFAAKRMVDERHGARLEADAVVAYDAGPVHAAVDLGGSIEIVEGEDDIDVYPAAGVSVEVIEDLRVGGEVFGELVPREGDESWLAVGPDLAWTRGRFWLSAAFGIGVLGIDAAPRLNWGIAF